MPMQEANRRARDIAREEALAAAPADVRADVEAEVHLGDRGGGGGIK